MRLPWSVAPENATAIQKQNFRNVQLDALGVGIASAAAPFRTVFLTRLGASSFQVGLLTSMPAITGFFLAIAAGRFLERRRNIVPWYSATRLVAFSAYTLTGLAPFIVPQAYLVSAILFICALATLPTMLTDVCFNVVMSSVAGPRLRYELMSRRWSILGLSTAILVAITGRVLGLLRFPLNYQLALIGLSVGGLLAYHYAIRIRLPDTAPSPPVSAQAAPKGLRGYIQLIRSQRAFATFISIRFVYFLGHTLSLPLFTLYQVRVVQASDVWIGLINTVQTATMLIGYYIWTRQSRQHGSRFVLLVTTLGLSFYPALVAATRQVAVLTLLGGLSGIFQAGLDLVFFDQLMKTVPPESRTLFISLALNLQYLATIVAPLFGALLADRIGIAPTLLISSGLRFTAFCLFFFMYGKRVSPSAA